MHRVSGQSLRDFSDAHIFAPLGMTRTFFSDDPSESLPDRALGYTGVAGGFRVGVRSSPSGSVGNSGLQSTAGDLLRWQQNFADVRVGTPALLEAMQTPLVLPDGTTTPTGLGVVPAAYRGQRTVSATGRTFGYAAHVIRYLESGLGVAVLCNLDSIDVIELAHRVADLYLADELIDREPAVPPAAVPRASVSNAEIVRTVGVYHLAAFDALMQVYRSDDVLMLTQPDGGMRAALLPVSANRFNIEGTPADVEFVSGADGRVVEMHTLAGPTATIWQRVETPRLSATELRQFVGTYFSPELDVTYTLVESASGLTIRVPGRADHPIQPMSRDEFRDAVDLADLDALAPDMIGIVRFSRDAHGAVDGFTLNRPRMLGVRFDRLAR